MLIVRRVITNSWITVIGGMCYSIYLLHNYAIAALGMVTERRRIDVVAFDMVWTIYAQDPPRSGPVEIRIDQSRVPVSARPT